MDTKTKTSRAPVGLDDIASHAHNLHGAAQTVAEHLAEDGHFDAAGRVLLLGQHAYHGILELRTTHAVLFTGEHEAKTATAASAKPGKRADAVPPCAGGGRHKWGPDNRCTRDGCAATNPRQPALPGAA